MSKFYILLVCQTFVSCPFHNMDCIAILFRISHSAQNGDVCAHHSVAGPNKLSGASQHPACLEGKPWSGFPSLPNTNVCLSIVRPVPAVLYEFTLWYTDTHSMKLHKLNANYEHKTWSFKDIPLEEEKYFFFYDQNIQMPKETKFVDPPIKIWKLLDIAFRKYMTSPGSWTLHDGPETPTQWKSVSMTNLIN